MTKLQFDSLDSIDLSMKIPEDTTALLFKRLQLFVEELMRKDAGLLKKHFGEGKIKEICALVDAHDDESVEKFEKIVGHSKRNLTLFELFLSSELFKGLNWEPTTPNDFFALGFVFSKYQESREDTPLQMLRDLRKMVTELKNHVE